MNFKEDQLENEKNDPHESSSLKFVNVPLFLFAMLLGFGITYLALRTNNTNMTPGDSRTQAQSEAIKTPPSDVKVDLASLMEKGKQIYTTTCQACHQPTGSGIPGAFPPLAESEWVNGPGSRMVAIILHGIQGEITVKGQKFKNVMPSFQNQLEPEDIAAVATYVRNSFGNKADLITPELAAKVKEETKSKGSPWGGEADLNAQTWK